MQRTAGQALVEPSHQGARVGGQRELVGVIGLDGARIVDRAGQVIDIAHHRGFGTDLELRRHPVLRGNGRVRRHIARSEKIEHTGRTQRHLAQVGIGVSEPQVPQAVGIARTESAPPLHDAQHRLAQLAKGSQSARRTRLGVQPNGLEHGSQIAAHASAIVGKDRRYTGHISAARVAGDQALDQLFADKGGGIGVVEQSIQRNFEVARAVYGGAGGNRLAQKAFFFRAVQRAGQHHGHHMAVGSGRQYAAGVVGRRRVPAGKNFGQALNVGVVVGFLRVAAGVQCQGAVGLQAVQTDGKELHDLAGVVFVRQSAGDRVGLLVALHIEIRAHGRGQGDGVQQSAEIAKRVFLKNVPIIGQREVFPGHRPQTQGRYDEDFRQSQRSALAYRVGRGEQLVPNGIGPATVAIDIAVNAGVSKAFGDQPVGHALRWRHVHLFGQPRRRAFLGHGLQCGPVTAQARLVDQAAGRSSVRERVGGNGGLCAAATPTGPCASTGGRCASSSSAASGQGERGCRDTQQALGAGMGRE